MKSFEWDIFKRRTTAFAFWAATGLEYPPVLVVGKLKTSETEGKIPYEFDELVRQSLELVNTIEQPHLYELEISKIKTKQNAN